MDTLRDRIDYIRKKRGLSFKQLADMIGGISGDGLRKAIDRGSAKDVFYAERIAVETGFSEEWVTEGVGDKIIDISVNQEIMDNPNLYFEKEGVKIHIDEIVDFMEERYKVLLKESNKYKFFMGDKANALMYKFFKEHGIEVKVNNSETELEN